MVLSRHSRCVHHVHGICLFSVLGVIECVKSYFRRLRVGLLWDCWLFVARVWIWSEICCHRVLSSWYRLNSLSVGVFWRIWCSMLLLFALVARM